MKAWKLDLWIALAALIVSALTASAALYQSKVFSDQLSATVWPYLTFNATLGPTSVELTLDNDGAGPAIIDGALLSVDGKPESSMSNAMKDLAKLARQRGSIAYSTGSIGAAQVIRAGAQALIVRVSAHDLSKLRAVYPRMAMSVYYCSLLNRCWVVKLHTSERPVDVTGRPYPHTSIQ